MKDVQRRNDSEDKQAASIAWYAVHPPRGFDLAALTAALRPLASRPKLGLFKRTAPVVLEVWARHGMIYWLLGLDKRLNKEIIRQIEAQLPGLKINRSPRHPRAPVKRAARLHVTGIAEPLRFDVASAVSSGLLGSLARLAPTETAVVQWLIGSSQSRQVAPSTALSGHQQNPADQQRFWRIKSSEPLFAVRGFIGASAVRPERTAAIIRSVSACLSLANGTHSQVQQTRPTRGRAKTLLGVGTLGRWSGILNAAELAALIGWPVAGTHLPPNVRLPLSGAPNALLTTNPKPNTRTVGVGLHSVDRGQHVMVPTASSLHHLHVTGVTGSGKSNQLARFIRADIAAGHSVFVMEPRGDLITDVLSHVPRERWDDVVLIEPGTVGAVTGFNPLAGSRHEAERRADELLHLFHRLHGNNLGPRSSDVLLHALTALARNRNGSLADLPVLLTNPTFRRQVLSETTDPLVLAPFFAWYDSLSDAERSQVVAPVLNKTRAFISRTSVRRLVGQAAPRFSLDELGLRPKIVLVNLNTGTIGAETSALIGSLLMHHLWQAVQRRALLPTTKRFPVMVVIDEVQNYLSLPVDIGDMLAQARALGVSLTLAHQHLNQLTPSLRAAFFANARSRMTLQPSANDEKALAAVLGGGVTPDDLGRLAPFEAVVRLYANHLTSAPFMVRTERLPPGGTNIAKLRAHSQQRFGVDGQELDTALHARWHPTPAPADSPIGRRRRTAA